MINGWNNTFIGYRAGYSANHTTTNSANSNVYLGYKAGLLNVSGYQNVIIGSSAGSAAATGSDNILIGSAAGQSTIGGMNVVIGSMANVNGSFMGNIVLGYQAKSSGDYNIALGQYSGYASTSDTSVFLGFCSGRYETNTSRLYISNKWVNSYADGLAKTLIYGEFDNKILRFNASVGIGLAPGYQLQLSQNSAAKPGTNTWTIASDIRLKDVKGKYTKGLNEILLLDPIIYRYKKDNAIDIKETEKDFYGFSAQDVQKIFPEAVGIDNRGYLNFDIHPILIAEINAFKELNTKIEDQQKQIEKLEKDNNQLKADIEKIKQMLESKNK
jgi:trimeric autotransporter adhesin